MSEEVPSTSFAELDGNGNGNGNDIHDQHCVMATRSRSALVIALTGDDPADGRDRPWSGIPLAVRLGSAEVYRHVLVGRVASSSGILGLMTNVVRGRVPRFGLVAAGLVVSLVGMALLLVSMVSMGSMEATRAPLAVALVLIASGLALIVGGVRYGASDH